MKRDRASATGNDVPRARTPTQASPRPAAEAAGKKRRRAARSAPSRPGKPARVRAVLLADRLPPLRGGSWRTLASVPTTVRLGEEGFAVLMRYGAVVFFGVPAEREEALLRELAGGPPGAPTVIESEETEIIVAPGAGDGLDASGRIRLEALTPERMQTIADVLAKCAVLNHYEARVAAAFDRVEPLAHRLRRGGRMAGLTRDLLRHLGEVLLTEHRMVGRAEVSERPEVLWDHPELERLHLLLAQEYELRDRDRALTRKLNLISRTAATVLDIASHERSLRVEWYIVILILIEIMLTLHELFWR